MNKHPETSQRFRLRLLATDKPALWVIVAIGSIIMALQLRSIIG